MDGRTFLDVARELIQGQSEAHWRTAAGRAYYSLILEARAALLRWGILIPPRDSVHAAVRLRFLYASDPDLHQFGLTLDDLGQLRNEADYRLSRAGSFATAAAATRAVNQAVQALAALDQVEADKLRLAAAAADIRARWP
jgi:uncharacterized protein (UPF0332 family)